MRVIGVTGGVASGKSLVADQLRRLGALVLDADRAGHEVLEQEAVREALRSRWGESVFRKDGCVDRAAVARRVFAAPPAGPPERRFLEQLTHPRIAEKIQREAEAAANRGFSAVVLDAPLLYEAGWDRLCDQVLFVSAPRAIRLERARQRGWSEAEFAAREAAQTPVEEKQRQADVSIDNGGTVEDTAAQVERWWNNLFNLSRNH